MGNDQFDNIFSLLHKIDREQGVVIEKLSVMQENFAWLESRVDKLEDRTQGLTWVKQSKNLLLWVAALAGGISACVSIIGQFR